MLVPACLSPAQENSLAAGTYKEGQWTNMPEFLVTLEVETAAAVIPGVLDQPGQTQWDPIKDETYSLLSQRVKQPHTLKLHFRGMDRRLLKTWAKAGGVIFFGKNGPGDY